MTGQAAFGKTSHDELTDLRGAVSDGIPSLWTSGPVFLPLSFFSVVGPLHMVSGIEIISNALC